MADEKSPFEKLAIKLGIELDVDSLEVSRVKVEKYLDKFSPLLQGITKDSIFDINTFDKLVTSLGAGPIKELGEMLSEFGPSEVMKSFDGVSAGLERNQVNILENMKSLMESIKELKLPFPLPSMFSLDPKDQATQLIALMGDVKWAAEDLLKGMQSKNVGGKLESFGLLGDINGMIKKFQLVNEAIKKGITIDPALLKNLGFVGHLFRGIAEGASAAGGTMAKIAAGTEVASSGFMALGNSILTAWMEATFGIAGIIAGLVWIAKTLASVIGKAVFGMIDYRESLKAIDQLYGGMGNNLLKFSDASRKTNIELMSLGLAVEDQQKTMIEFMKSGMSWTKATGSELVGTSLMAARAFGMADDAAAGFIGKLVVSNKLSEKGVKTMFDQLALAKKFTAEIGLAPIAMEKFQEAVESSSEAFGLGASKGEAFTKRLSADMITLTSLTTALGLGIGDIARKFEEAGNLVTNTDNKFRTLMLISGGATIRDMMTGEVNRTKASMAMIEKLQQFNRALGGNIQLSSQLAEKTFGIQKDQAIKMMNMTQEEKRKQLALMVETEKLVGGELAKNYEGVTGTIMEAINKFKNIMNNIWMQIVSNKQIQDAVDAVGKKFNELLKFFEAPEGKAIISKLTDMLSIVLSKIPILVQSLMDNLGPFVEKISTMLNSMSGEGGKGLFDSFGDMLQDFLLGAFMEYVKLVVKFGFIDFPMLILQGLWELVKAIPGLIWDLLVFTFIKLPILILKGLWELVKLLFDLLVFEFIKLPIIIAKFLVEGIIKGLVWVFLELPTMINNTTKSVLIWFRDSLKSAIAWLSQDFSKLFSGGNGNNPAMKFFKETILPVIKELAWETPKMLLGLLNEIGKLLYIELPKAIFNAIKSIQLPNLLSKIFTADFWKSGFMSLIDRIWNNIKEIPNFLSKIFTADFWKSGFMSLIDRIWNSLKETFSWFMGEAGNENTTGKQIEKIAGTQASSKEELDIYSQRLSGAKDTDVMWDKGEWKFVGEKRAEIDEQKIALAKKTVEILERIEKKDQGVMEKTNNFIKTAMPDHNSTIGKAINYATGGSYK